MLEGQGRVIGAMALGFLGWALYRVLWLRLRAVYAARQAARAVDAFLMGSSQLPR